MDLAVVEVSQEAMDTFVGRYSHPAMPVLEACAEGRTVIDIQETFRRAGLWRGFPRLGFSSAFRPEATYWWGDGEHRFELIDARRIDILRFREPRPSFWERLRLVHYYSSVCPPIPNEVAEQQEDGDVLCWEVDRWERQPVQALGDPVMLRHLYKDYWAVVGEWDLTPLEASLFTIS